MLRRYILLVVATTGLLACRPFGKTPAQGPSDTQGLLGRATPPAILPPLPKSKTTLARVSKEFLESSTRTFRGPLKSPTQELYGTLAKSIIKAEGIPRSQLKEVLSRVVAPESTACGGASCAKIFGFKNQDVDTFLDHALEHAHKNPLLAQPDMAHEKALLISSLERRPAWLNPGDFGPPLTPRKAYDLAAELKTYKDCPQCSISARAGEIRSMIESAREGDHFLWVLRPDGRLVVGRGPDEKMSHGVLASVDLIDQKKTASITLPVLASGEGFIDPLHHTLVLNNKSGHYRPEFQRVQNPSVKRLFEAMMPSSAHSILFVDLSKPR